MSHLEDELQRQIDLIGLMDYQREYKFHPDRRWRFDFAFTEQMLAIEVEGATWAQGRHTRGDGFAKDCEKYNAAVAMGWRVLRFTADMVHDGTAISVIESVMKGLDSD